MPTNRPLATAAGPGEATCRSVLAQVHSVRPNCNREAETTQDFYVDLLFYHRRLRCLIAVDLKVGAFRPEHADKMNFYLAALDDLEREPDDNPSIGLILCRERNQFVVEYTLRGVDTPIGVSRYQTLPAPLAAALPSPEELEPGLFSDLDDDGA